MSPISKYAHMPWASTHPFDSRDIAVSIVKTILHFFFLLRLFFIIIIILASSLTSELRCCCERKKKYRISSFWSYCCYWILNSELKKCLKKDWDEKYILRKDFFWQSFISLVHNGVCMMNFIFFSVIMRMYFVVDEEINIIMTFWYFVGEIQGHCFSTFHKYK